ncbi:MAG: hypothetical protein CVU57_13825 [Deltaproteobacteria bacterium HGW-Deltaproteobacteria-15]|nr:MAG: hypothetical protein CVU57_13825 [Deltaproteobacteria bacterium HGW-Deltaproteobacteria-15]
MCEESGYSAKARKYWIPAFAGMTTKRVFSTFYETINIQCQTSNEGPNANGHTSLNCRRLRLPLRLIAFFR